MALTPSTMLPLGTPLPQALLERERNRGALEEVVGRLPAAAALALVIDPPTGLLPVIFGEVTAGEGLVARSADGTIEPLQPRGWLHDGT